MVTSAETVVVRTRARRRWAPKGRLILVSGAAPEAVWQIDAMHILVATDGHLDPEKATDFVARLHEPDDTVTVLTALDHPREFLRDFAELTGVEEVAKIAHEARAGMMGGGSMAAERMAPRVASGTHVQQLNVYFTTTAQRRVKDLLARLESRGITATAMWSPTENQTAKTIMTVAAREGADVLVVGSHGAGRFEGALGSTVTKLVRRAPMPVLVIR